MFVDNLKPSKNGLCQNGGKMTLFEFIVNIFFKQKK